jgi:hypothetical protein
VRGANCRPRQLVKLRAEQSQNLLRFSREGALERPAYQIIDFQPVTRRTMLAPYSSLTRTTKASLRDLRWSGSGAFQTCDDGAAATHGLHSAR